jgi:alcohol dehydrogenase
LPPAVVRYNLLSRCLEAAAVARALGSRATDDSEASEAQPRLLSELAQSAGIAPGLEALGVTEANLPEMAAAAAGIRRLADNNPRSVDADALLEVLRTALHCTY